MSKKYQTPYKSLYTTNVTKGNTLSFSTFTQQKKQMSLQKNSTLKSSHSKCAKTKQSTLVTSQKIQGREKEKNKRNNKTKKR